VFWPGFEPFWPLLVRMRRNGHKTTFGQICNPKFEIPMSWFLFEYKFWQRFRQDLYVFCTKNCFRNVNFSEFADIGGRGENFWTKHQKAHLCLSHRKVIFYAFAVNYPFNQIQPNCIQVGVADVINHTNFDNDRFRECKIAEGRILACSIGMACCLTLLL